MHSGYFRLVTTVALGMGITDGKFLLCHFISEEMVDNKIPTREYNNRVVYDWFNDSFPDDFDSPYLNLPTITLDGRPSPHNRARYTPYLLQDTIYVAYENSGITLTTPSSSPKLLLLPSDDTNHLHAMNKYDPYCGRTKIGYWYRKHDEIKCYKKTRLFCSTCFDKDKKFYYCHGLSRINSETMTCFM